MQRDLNLDAALNNEERLKALQDSNLLDTPQEEVFNQITREICETLDVPISLVTLIAPERQFFKSAIGLGDEAMRTRQTPIDESTCKYVVERNCLLRIDDVEKDHFFRWHEGLMNVDAGAYLGTPLRFKDQAIGSICAVDVKPRFWSKGEIQFIEAKASFLADIVTARSK